MTLMCILRPGCAMLTSIQSCNLRSGEIFLRRRCKGKGECNMGYLQMYPDVANEFQSGLEHWVMHGKKEGREPYCKEWMDY
mmetsp:Transcript_11999/g.20354  ORF Transcript_11999/g.20354 Transcript_11999/m.20354 type:complete len:81 (-) Transcript_11999:2556-2798(-)